MLLSRSHFQSWEAGGTSADSALSWGGLSTGVGGLWAHRGMGSPVCLEPKGQELPSVARQHDLEE